MFNKKQSEIGSAILHHRHGYPGIDISGVREWYGGYGEFVFVASRVIRELATSEQLAMPSVYSSDYILEGVREWVGDGRIARNWQ